MTGFARHQRFQHIGMRISRLRGFFCGEGGETDETGQIDQIVVRGVFGQAIKAGFYREGQIATSVGHGEATPEKYTPIKFERLSRCLPEHLTFALHAKHIT